MPTDNLLIACIKAMPEALNKYSFCRAEEAGFRHIENIRESYLSDHSILHIPDFGAGPLWKSLLGMPPPAGNDQQRTVADLCRRSSTGPSEARTIYALAKLVQPAITLELGTCLGISAAYLAMASGRVYTIEGAPEVSALARQKLTDYPNICFHTGPFQNVLPRVLGEMDQKIGFAYIDGHHEGQATLRYWEQLKPVLQPCAVVVFDDIRYNRGMARAWRLITCEKDILAHHTFGPAWNPMRRKGVVVMRGLE